MLYLTVFVASLVVVVSGQLRFGFLGHDDYMIPEGITKTLKYGILNDARYPLNTLGIDVELDVSSPKNRITVKPEKLRFLPGEHRFFNVDILVEDNRLELINSAVTCNSKITFQFTNGSRILQPSLQQPFKFALIDASNLVSFGFLGYSGQPITIGETNEIMFGNYGPSFPLGVEELQFNIEISSVGRQIHVYPNTLIFSPSSPNTQTITVLIERNNKNGIDTRVTFSATVLKVYDEGKVEKTLTNQPTITATVDDKSIDPFIIQTVRGEDSMGRSSYYDICYDFQSRMGERLEFLSDLILGFSAVCEFRDNYHIERIFVKTRQGTIVITRNKFISVNGESFSWSDLNEQIIGHDPLVIVQSDGEKITIKTTSGDRKLALDIVRVNDDITTSHLNIIIQQTTSGIDLDKFNGGIFGIAANNNYKFIRPVQGDDGTIVIVNNEVITSSLKTLKNSKKKCISLALDDLVDVRVVTVSSGMKLR